jgi:DNA-binding NtrC family response regulator
VFPVQLPPLRDRSDDIVLLANHFLEQLNKNESTSKRLAPAAMAAIRAHPWPGNVRELKNAMHRAFILADQEIDARTFSGGATPAAPVRQTSDGAPGTNLHVRVGASVADVERSLILATLEDCQGDKKRTAEILQISLKTLYNRLNEYKVE